MSYDISFHVKIEGLDKYIQFTTPEVDNPTYNLGTMFRKCMDWDFKQGEKYLVKDIIPHLDKGIYELSVYPEKYRQYEPPNGWGSISGANRTLRSIAERIKEIKEEYELPEDKFYMSW